MKRKLIKQRNSYTLTVPKEWVADTKLKGGDEVTLEADGNCLMIWAKKPRGKSKKVSSVATKDFPVKDVLERLGTLTELLLGSLHMSTYDVDSFDTEVRILKAQLNVLESESVGEAYVVDARRAIDALEHMHVLFDRFNIDSSSHSVHMLKKVFAYVKGEIVDFDALLRRDLLGGVAKLHGVEAVICSNLADFVKSFQGLKSRK
jgi:hypothetical protein